MKFGTKVVVERGGGNAPMTKGCHRFIQGTLVGARASEYFVRLDEDDPFSTSPEWSKKGDIGHWSKSAVTQIT